MDLTDYMKYRGKCKEFCETLISNDPALVLVRGWYDCPFEGKQEHWWCKDQQGNIIDPTKKQFMSKGAGEYIEFDGYFTCEECGKKVHESRVQWASRYPVCSGECHMKLVGLA